MRRRKVQQKRQADSIHSRQWGLVDRTRLQCMRMMQRGQGLDPERSADFACELRVESGMSWSSVREPRNPAGSIAGF